MISLSFWSFLEWFLAFVAMVAVFYFIYIKYKKMNEKKSDGKYDGSGGGTSTEGDPPSDEVEYKDM